MSSVLVTGINGFVGPHVAREFAAHDVDVHGIAGPSAETSPHDIDLADYTRVDLFDPEAVHEIDLSEVDDVVHLAGLVSVAASFGAPAEYIETNRRMQVNLFEAALRQGVRPRFMIASSGGIYDGSGPRPSTEASDVKAVSPYAESKLAQEAEARIYGEEHGFEYIVVRGFNMLGPGGLKPNFLASTLIRQLVEARPDQSPTVSVGNLDAARDYTDVRDVAKAYRLLAESGKSGEIYNVCSGTALTGHELLATLAAAAECEPIVRQDPDQVRPTDTPLSVGSYDKLRRDTGWQPAIPIETTLRDMLEERLAIAGAS